MTPERPAGKALGEKCEAPGDVCQAPLLCVDGVCCADECIADCMACDRPGRLGLCSGVVHDSDPDTCVAPMTCREGGVCHVTPTTWFVKADAAGAGDGTSWEDAFNEVQPAADVAGPGDWVWVAAGTYTSTEAQVLLMKPFPGELQRTKYFGGFVGDETLLEQRPDPMQNPSILDGEEVRRGVVAASRVHFDGFIIRRGVAPMEAGSVAPHVGGMQLVGVTDVVIANTRFEENAGPNGGGLGIDGSKRVTVTGGTFDSNTGVAGGGFSVTDSHVTFVDSSFNGNRVSYIYDALGGGGYAYESFLTLVRCAFTGNVAEAGGHGGGLYLVGGHHKVYDTTFTQNTTEGGLGGGLMAELSGNGSGTLELRGGLFTGNQAAAGAGIWIRQDPPRPILQSVRFESNIAEDRGGGVRVLDSPAVLRDCHFSGNVAGKDGGGLSSDHQVRVRGGSWTGNTAGDSGGAIHVYDGDLDARYTRFVGNEASDGGAVYALDSVVAATGSVWTENTATNDGGALFVSGGVASISSSTLAHNQAFKGGGAVRNDAASLDIVESILWGNFASFGESMLNSDSIPTVARSIVAGGHPGEGNLDVDPGFVADSLRLTVTSPARDAGADLSGVGETGAPEVDLDGHVRPSPSQGAYDIGAYEYQAGEPFRRSIALDGVDDFGEAGTVFSSNVDLGGRVAWDDAYLYVGLSIERTIPNGSRVLVYVGDDETPSFGRAFDGQQPSLPFYATRLVSFETNGTAAEVDAFDPTGWVPVGDGGTIVVSAAGFVEARVPWPTLAVADRFFLHISVVSPGFWGETVAAVPDDSFADSFNPIYTSRLELDRAGPAAPARRWIAPTSLP